MAGTIKLPPAHLRERVSCTADVREYLIVGSRTASAVRNLLAQAGYDLAAFARILDFACGCGRTLNFIPEYVTPDRLYGCDYDEELVGWCRGNLDLKECRANRSNPPLDYPDGHFDLVYVISFLTHLPENAQLSWLREWKRVLRPDGLILVSLLGERLARRQGVKIPSGSCLYLDSGKKFNEKVCWHSRSYIERSWGRDFSILAYSELGLNDHQDLLLLGTPASSSRVVQPRPMLELPRQLREVWQRREDLQRNFDPGGIGYPDSYWRNLSLLDWALFDGWKEEESLRFLSLEARYKLIEGSHGDAKPP